MRAGERLVVLRGYDRVGRLADAVGQRAEPDRPTITYISTFDESRTDAEILRSNLENQKRKEEAQALEAARIERRKELYRQLGRATGLDVDEMERQIAVEEAAEAAEKARLQRELEARRMAAQAQAAATGE